MVHARCDLPERGDAPDASLAVSSVTQEGLDQLLARVEALARTLLPGEDAIALNRRQAAHIAEAAEALEGAASAHDLVLLAEDLRAARAAFDRLTGRASLEDVLDALFGRFCLGK
jgi:tRNA modification GTPase